MNSLPDLHVVRLFYTLCVSDTVTFEDPPDVEITIVEAKYLLSRGILQCEMLTHFATEQDARKAVEPFIRAWEADADFCWGRGEFRLEFKNAEIIDQLPPVSGNLRTLNVCVHSSAVAGGTATVHVGRKHYPEPPVHFRLNLNAETLWLRYQGFLDGKEPLLSMGYFCLSLLEAIAGGRRKAAACYHVDELVLRKLGEFTSIRGDRHTARKAAVGEVEMLSDRERAWIEALMKLLIWRVGDTRDVVSLATIGLSDLPAL